MADKPEAAEVKKPAKSKLMIMIIGGVVLLALVGGGIGFYLYKQRAAAAAAAEDGGDGAPKAAAKEASSAPPSYLPMDNMVVNLADPGGERVAQVGITLVVTDAHKAEEVKAFLPTIRSGVLLLISQRTADELLKSEGKEKLAKDILREAIKPFGGGDEDPPDDAPAGKKKRKTAQPEYPVVGVLFSSFIVQ